MSGAQAPIYLLEKAADTPAAGATRQPRDYARHWTPVHLDVVVDDVDAAVTRAVAAGARLEPGRHACLGPHRPPERPVRPWHLPAAVPGPGLRRTGRTGAALPAVSEADFEDLLALRIAAMRESLERLGRFDPERAQPARATFRPEYTRAIELEGKRVGFYALRPDGDGLRLDHLYLHPSSQAGAWAAARSGACWRRPTHRACRCAWAPCAAATRTASTSATASSRSKKRWDIEYLRPAQAKPGLTPPSRATAALPPRNAARPPPRTEQSRAREDQRRSTPQPNKTAPIRGRADPAPPVRSQHPWKRAALRGPLRSRQRHAALA